MVVVVTEPPVVCFTSIVMGDGTVYNEFKLIDMRRIISDMDDDGLTPEDKKLLEHLTIERHRKRLLVVKSGVVLV